MRYRNALHSTPRCAVHKTFQRPIQYKMPLDKGPNDKTIMTELPMKDRCFIKLSCMGQIHSCLIDTGASHSIMSASLYYNLPRAPPLQASPLKAFAVANNGRLSCIGQVELPVLMGSQYVRITFQVVPQLLHDMIIGRDCLTKYKARIDYEKDSMQLDVIEGLFCTETVSIPPQSQRQIPVKMRDK